MRKEASHLLEFYGNDFPVNVKTLIDVAGTLLTQAASRGPATE